MSNEEVFEKLNDYTISATLDFDRMERADSELRRIFNFKAQQVTSIYSMWYSQAVTSSMTTQKFSEFDSLDEIKLMHEKLVELDGHPPALPAPNDGLGKPRIPTPTR